MASLQSMKQDSDESMYTPYTPGKYSSGLCIYLSDEECEALGLTKAIKPGTQVSISALATVTSSTESLDRDMDGGNDVSVSLQITDMGITIKGMVRNAAADLYGSED